MPASRLQMNSNGRRLPFFAEPALSSADHAWGGYYFEEAHGPAEPIPAHSWPKTTLLLVTDGGGSLNWKHRGVWRTDAVRRGTVSIIRRGAEIQTCVPSNSMPTIVLQLDNSKLQHAAPDNVLAIDRALESAQVTTDFRLAALMFAMCEEVRDGCPSGPLFAESISLALLAYLAGTYVSPRCANNCLKRLSSGQKRLLIDYIRANVTANITVAELAEITRMSPSHFTRVFSAAFGISPYRFVMVERISCAKTMLATTHLSASDIASACGFSSQSHFAKVFRQLTGLNPKQYRAGL